MDNLRNITPELTAIKTGTRGFKDEAGNYFLTALGGDFVPAGQTAASDPSLILYAPLSAESSTAETGQTITNNGGTFSTIGGIPCVTFDGSSQLSIVWSAVTGNRARTLSCWVRPVSKVSATTWNGLICYGSAASRAWFGIAINNNGCLTFSFYDGDYASAPPSYGTWYHLAFVYDGENYTGYINGNSGVTGSMRAAGFVNTTSSALILGNNPGGEHSNCSIAAVRIYNRALTAAEITALSAEFSAGE